MAISPLAGPRMPDEIKLKYLEKLSFPDLQNAAFVCKNWLELSCETGLWKPIFKELSQQYTCNEGEEIKSAVLRNLRQDQQLVNQIIRLFSNPQQLADIIGCPLETVERFPTMLPIECSWHVMRGLRRDCTQLFKQFPHIQLRRMKQYLFEFAPTYESPSKFYAQDLGFSLFFKMLEAPPGPFNEVGAFRAAFALQLAFHTTENLEIFLNAYASIIKRHPNLSGFFEENFSIDNTARGAITGAKLVSDRLIPQMEQYKIAVTLEDWVKCGYKPPS